MSVRPRSLPLAPRPWPGEATLSWIARLAARYDLAGADLLAWLNGDEAVDVWRARRLDWRGEGELDRRLAIAADLDLGRLEVLRVPPTAAAEAERWSRRFVACCPDCVREDIACHGETSARASWKLGFWVSCGVHGGRLADQCGICGAKQFIFGPIRGRLRLLCGGCGRLADQGPLAVSWRLLEERPGPLGVWRSSGFTRLVAAMQADLWVALATPTPLMAGPWSVGMAADLAGIVRELGAIFLSTAWLPAGCPERQREREGDFATVPVDVAVDGLGLIAATLSEVCTGAPAGIAWTGPGGTRRDLVPVNLTSLVFGLGERALSALERAADGWPPVLAEAARRAVGVPQDRRGRERMLAEQRRRAVRRHGPPERLRAMAARRMARRARRSAFKRRAGEGGFS